MDHRPTDGSSGGRRVALALSVAGLLAATAHAHASQLTAAVEAPGGDDLYLFTDEGTYLRYRQSTGAVVEDAPVDGNWDCVDGEVDAALAWKGRIYLFSGDQYARLDATTRTCVDGYPKPLLGNWPGVMWDGVDAAVSYNGKAFLFRGSNYIRYDLARDRADGGYPKTIPSGWRGLWGADLDAAVLARGGKALFFRGDELIRFDTVSDRADGKAEPLASLLGGGSGGGAACRVTRAGDSCPPPAKPAATKPVAASFPAPPKSIKPETIDRSSLSLTAGWNGAEPPHDWIELESIYDSSDIRWTGWYLTQDAATPGRSWIPASDPMYWPRYFLSRRESAHGHAPIWFGPQDHALANKTPEQARKLGVDNAAKAAALADKAGVPRQSNLFVDIEGDGPVTAALAAYYQGWLEGVGKRGFRAGVYTGVHRAMGLLDVDSRAAFWVAAYTLMKWDPPNNCPATPYSPPADPARSGACFAIAWQYYGTPDLARQCKIRGADLNAPAGARGVPADFNTSITTDPASVLPVNRFATSTATTKWAGGWTHVVPFTAYEGSRPSKDGWYLAYSATSGDLSVSRLRSSTSVDLAAWDTQEVFLDGQPVGFTDIVPLRFASGRNPRFLAINRVTGAIGFIKLTFTRSGWSAKFTVSSTALPALGQAYTPYLIGRTSGVFVYGATAQSLQDLDGHGEVTATRWSDSNWSANWTGMLPLDVGGKTMALAYSRDWVSLNAIDGKAPYGATEMVRQGTAGTALANAGKLSTFELRGRTYVVNYQPSTGMATLAWVDLAGKRLVSAPEVIQLERGLTEVAPITIAGTIYFLGYATDGRRGRAVLARYCG